MNANTPVISAITALAKQIPATTRLIQVTHVAYPFKVRTLLPNETSAAVPAATPAAPKAFRSLCVFNDIAPVNAPIAARRARSKQTSSSPVRFFGAGAAGDVMASAGCSLKKRTTAA